MTGNQKRLNGIEGHPVDNLGHIVFDDVSGFLAFANLAIVLIEASEYVQVDTPADIIEAEVSAVAAFKRLATILDANPDRLRQQLTRATEAATS